MHIVLIVIPYILVLDDSPARECKAETSRVSTCVERLTDAVLVDSKGFECLFYAGATVWFGEVATFSNLCRDVELAHLS